MTPDDLAKGGSEHGHQVALFAYVAVARLHGFAAADAWADTGVRPLALDPSEAPMLPMLKWYHAIPNGGARGEGRAGPIRGAHLKAEGVRTGVADTFLPYPRNGWHGLYLELKKPSEKPVRGGMGGVSDDQRDFGAYVSEQGYAWVVAYGWREAANVLKQYLGHWQGQYTVHEKPPVDNTQ